MPSLSRTDRQVSPRQLPSNQPKQYALLSFLCLATVLAFAQGCGGPEASQQQNVAKQDDPEADFEWVVKRLRRLLRPMHGGGLSITDRKVEYELFPPDDQNPLYTARVTVSSETSFLHKQRQSKKIEEIVAEQKTALDLDDPLADEADEVIEFTEIPGMGPRVPASAAAKVETRSITNQSVFELEYLEGRWQLTEEPESEHEQGWFRYALQ